MTEFYKKVRVFINVKYIIFSNYLNTCDQMELNYLEQNINNLIKKSSLESLIRNSILELNRGKQYSQKNPQFKRIKSLAPSLIVICR